MKKWEDILTACLIIIFTIGILLAFADGVRQENIKQKIISEKQCWCSGFMPYNCDKNLNCSIK